MTCPGEVQQNVLYNSADVVGSVVRFVRGGKFTCSGVHLRAHSDKILCFFDDRQLRWPSLKSLVLRQHWAPEGKWGSVRKLSSCLFRRFRRNWDFFVIIEQKGKCSFGGDKISGFTVSTISL
jgi:hypothetical protein